MPQAPLAFPNKRAPQVPDDKPSPFKRIRDSEAQGEPVLACVTWMLASQESMSGGLDQLLLKPGRTQTNPYTELHGRPKCVAAKCCPETLHSSLFVSLEFELTYFTTAIQHICHYATRILQGKFCQIFLKLLL